MSLKKSTDSKQFDNSSNSSHPIEHLNKTLRSIRNVNQLIIKEKDIVALAVQAGSR